MQSSSNGESGKETFLSRLLRLGRKEWIVLLLLGLLLAVISLPTSDTAEDEESTGLLAAGTGDTENSENTVLEEKLQNLLSQVEGVGETRVMIMTGQEDSSGFRSTDEETIVGVLVAAEGADNSVTVKNIKEAVMALFQIEAHRIKIMKMK